MLPYLYTDAVLTPAFRILDEAARAAQGDDAMVQARVRFLRDGLVHLEQTRDAIALVYDEDRPSAISEADIAARLAALQALRAELTPRHVVWGEVANWVELHRGVRNYRVRSKTITRSGAEMTVDLRLSQRADIVSHMLDIQGVYDATLVAVQNETAV